MQNLDLPLATRHFLPLCLNVGILPILNLDFRPIHFNPIIFKNSNKFIADIHIYTIYKNKLYRSIDIFNKTWIIFLKRLLEWIEKYV